MVSDQKKKADYLLEKKQNYNEEVVLIDKVTTYSRVHVHTHSLTHSLIHLFSYTGGAVTTT
jgi:hypothetical protein